MPGTLLRPQWLAYKNNFVGKQNQREREILISILFLLIMISSYLFVRSFLIEALNKEELPESFHRALPVTLIEFTLNSFFVLLVFSNTVAAFGFFYAAQDLPLLLSAPIKPQKLYLARLFQTALNSSWLLILFGVPAALAFFAVFQLSWSFLLSIIVLSVPFLLIPAAVGFIVVTCVVNIFPSDRIRELFSVGLLFAISLSIAYLQLNEHGERLENHLNHVEIHSSVEFLAKLKTPTPFWFPPTWISSILGSYFNDNKNSPHYVMITFSSTLIILFFGFFLFQRLFMRGWMLSLEGKKRSTVPSSIVLARLSRLIFPSSPQLHAFAYKEARMFLRDPVQGIQLLLLLTLTAFYLYNFRTLGSSPTFAPEISLWWHTILSIANILLGGCVLSAITTRFVFPSISLEGTSYWIIRTSPMTIRQILRRKFLTWLLPVGIISLILFLSGALASGVPLPAVAASAFISVCLSIGTVGLAIGIGAVYGNFRWETIAQVTASFGSLIYMLLSLALVIITTIPASILLIVTAMNSVALDLSPTQYGISVTSTGLVVMLINLQAAHLGLRSGEQSLSEREK